MQKARQRAGEALLEPSPRTGSDPRSGIFPASTRTWSLSLPPPFLIRDSHMDTGRLPQTNLFSPHDGDKTRRQSFLWVLSPLLHPLLFRIFDLPTATLSRDPWFHPLQHHLLGSPKKGNDLHKVIQGVCGRSAVT